MPLSPDSPNTKSVAGPVVTKNLTKMHIHQFQILVDPNGSAGNKVQLLVKWSEGYEDNGVYYPAAQHSAHFKGEELEASLQENTTGGSFYGEIKTKLWSWLQAQGQAPSGNVS